MHGGKRDGAGRKRGIPNRINAALRDRLNAGGLLPLELMLSVMRDERQELALRLEVARLAAPYLHARLQAVEHTDEHEKNAQRRFIVEFVPAKHEAASPSGERLPSNGMAQLTQGPCYRTDGGVVWEG